MAMGTSQIAAAANLLTRTELPRQQSPTEGAPHEHSTDAAPTLARNRCRPNRTPSRRETAHPEPRDARNAQDSARRRTRGAPSGQSKALAAADEPGGVPPRPMSDLRGAHNWRPPSRKATGNRDRLAASSGWSLKPLPRDPHRPAVGALAPPAYARARTQERQSRVVGRHPRPSIALHDRGSERG